MTGSRSHLSHAFTNRSPGSIDDDRIRYRIRASILEAWLAWVEENGGRGNTGICTQRDESSWLRTCVHQEGGTKVAVNIAVHRRLVNYCLAARLCDQDFSVPVDGVWVPSIEWRVDGYCRSMLIEQYLLKYPKEGTLYRVTSSLEKQGTLAAIE